jgi:hypothetical protein
MSGPKLSFNNTENPPKSKVIFLFKKLKLSHYMPRRRLEGEEIELLLILDLGTRWGEWSASRSSRALAPCTAGWVGPRAGLDTEA